MQYQNSTVFIGSAGNNYPIFKLFQTRKDPSIYLHLFGQPESKKTGVGKINFAGNPLTGKIEYTNPEIVSKRIDHSSIHKDGKTHTKFTDKTYFSKTPGLPLENLKSARHLWTIIPGTLKRQNIMTKLPKDHIILNTPGNVPSVAIVIFAIPKSTNFHFEFTFPVEDLEMNTGKFPINILPLEFNQYTICLFAYSTLKFKIAPPRTYAFSDVFNFISICERSE